MWNTIKNCLYLTSKLNNPITHVHYEKKTHSFFNVIWYQGQRGNQMKVSTGADILISVKFLDSLCVTGCPMHTDRK